MRGLMDQGGILILLFSPFSVSLLLDLVQLFLVHSLCIFWYGKGYYVIYKEVFFKFVVLWPVIYGNQGYYRSITYMYNANKATTCI